MNNIDTLFKKALRDKPVAPPAYVWENISRRLDARKKKKKAILWWYSGAASIALLLAFAYLAGIKITAEETVALTSSKIKQIEITKISASLINIPVRLPIIPPVYGRSQTIKESSPDFPLEIQCLNTGNAISSPLYPYNIKIPPIRKIFIPLINKKSYETLKLYQALLETDYTPQKEEQLSHKKGYEISLSGHFSPGYASGSYTPASEKAPRGYNYSKEQLNGMFNMSGGLKVAIATKGRFSMQAGILYTRMGIKTNEHNVYVPQNNIILNSVSRNHVSTVASPLGNINSKSHALVYKTTNTIAPLANNTNSANIEQVFGAVEIPLAIRYRLNNNRIRFSVSGGFSGSFIVSNKAYLNYGKKREFMGSTEDIRHFNISTDWALGVEYPLSSKIKIMLEPGFRYYLQSISQNKDVDFKPYMFSFSTGIGINF